MKFRRLDEDTVCCIVSEEDMKEHGLELEDFFTNKEKSRDFLMDIVEQAKEEVGYQAKGGVLAMQLMPITSNSLAITFSENGNQSFKNMFEHIKEATSMLDDMDNEDFANDIIQMDDQEELDKYMNNSLEEKEESKTKKVSKSNHKVKDKKQSTIKIYRFKSLGDVEQFSCSLAIDKIVTSRLFKDEKDCKYYLVIHKGRLSLKVYNNICENVLEFADFVSDNSVKLAYCEEHYKCLIKKKAINIMRRIGNGE